MEIGIDTCGLDGCLEVNMVKMSREGLKPSSWLDLGVCSSSMSRYCSECGAAAFVQGKLTLVKFRVSLSKT
jgi:hypothetical protein